VLAQLVELCQGDSAFGTMQQAISELGAPRVKSVRPTPSYKGLLTLGDPESENSDSVLKIYVERYPRIALAKPPTASAFVNRSDLASNIESTASSATIEANDETHGQHENGFAAVRSAHTYQVPDESAAGGKRDIDRDELEKGYEYGRTAVHISTSDETVTKLETEAALEIMGFVPQDKVKPTKSVPF
jgi:ATP-dependent DNA helicase 2 subunit 2